MGARVLLTGATGFIGRAITPVLLSRGFEVHALARRTFTPPPGNISTHCLDLMDTDSRKELIKSISPSHCLHLAWNALPGHYLTTRDNLLWTATTLELYNDFVKYGGQRFLGVGSCAEYDWSYGLMREADTPYRPSSLYGSAKNASRSLLQESALQDGISFAWAHLFFTFGPGESLGRLVSDIARGCLKGEIVPTSLGTQIRDYMYVKDVANALACLLEGPVEGAVNVASGIPRQVSEIIKAVSEEAGRPDLIELGGRKSSHEEPQRLVADVSRLQNEVGYNPSYTLINGVRETVDWWRFQIQENQFET